MPKRYQLVLRFFYLKRTNKLEEELIFASKLLNRKRRFLDVGANIGIYSYYFSNIFEKVDAFEPIKEITHRLLALKNESLKVHNVALSNKEGNVKFHIPIVKGNLRTPYASLEKRNVECEIRNVKVNTIDSYNFNDVDLIKIDVEGHERFVIEGAKILIKKCKPILIVEIEQRHLSIDIGTVFEGIKELEYTGFFLQNGSLTSLKEFNYERNQKEFLMGKNTKYVNNFIFLPNSNFE